MDKLKFDEKIITKILEKYGFKAQELKLAEECCELSAAILKNQSKNNNETFKAMIDEIADVAIMLEQVKYIFSTEAIQRRIDFKLNRQLNRIKESEK